MIGAQNWIPMPICTPGPMSYLMLVGKDGESYTPLSAVPPVRAALSFLASRVGGLSP
jgi:hypothetical protein